MIQIFTRVRSVKEWYPVVGHSARGWFMEPEAAGVTTHCVVRVMDSRRRIMAHYPESD